MTELAIVTTSAAFCYALSAVAPCRDWRAAVKRQPYAAVMIWSLFFGVFFLGGAREQGAAELVDSLRMLRVALFAILALSAWFTIMTGPRRPIEPVTGSFLLYGVVACATASYSLEPLLTIWKGFEILTHASVAAALSTRIRNVDTADDIFCIGWVALIFVTTTILSGILIAPDIAIRASLVPWSAGETAYTRMYGGVFPRVNPNEATQLGALVFSLSLAQISRSQWRQWHIGSVLLAALGCVVMYYSHSRTSIIACGISVLMILILGRGSLLIRTGVFVALLVLLLGVGEHHVVEYMLRGQREEELAHMSGRVPFWQDVIHMIAERPVLGYGFYAANRVIYGSSGLDNSYLVVTLGGGLLLLVPFLLGVVLLGGRILWSYAGLGGQGARDRYVWMQACSTFVILVARSATGPSFEQHHFNLPLFLLCGLAIHGILLSRR